VEVSPAHILSVRRICFTLILLTTSSLLAQNQWNLTTADLQTKPVELRAIDDTGIGISKTESLPAQLPWDQVLELTRQTVPKVAAGRFILHSAADDHLYGQPLRIADEKLIWGTPSLGELSVPLRHVIAVTRASKHAPQQKSGDAVTEDTVSLANGDQVKGIVSDVGNGNVNVQSGGSSVAVPLESVDAIVFASTAPAARSRDRSFRVMLADGSTVRASDLKLADQQVALKLADQTSKQIDFATVASIEQVNGPVAWLSGLEPADNVHTPYLQTPRPARMDRTVSGDPIRYGDKTFSRGIGVYPYSRLTWKLDGAYAGLRTRYAIDGSGPYANVTVRIKLDDRVVHEQSNFTGGKISPVIALPLGGAKTVTLEVGYGENFSVQDKFNWIEPALTKTLTQPAATQPPAAATQP
jgi:hypothetical protein